MRISPIPVAETRPLRHAVLRPRENLELLAGHESPDAFAVGAFDDDGRLVGVGFISPSDEHGNPGERGVWRVRGMATEPASRGRGAGSAVLGALLDHARERGAARVWCNARIGARTFYERAGFLVVSEEFEIPEIGPHYMMELRFVR